MHILFLNLSYGKKTGKHQLAAFKKINAFAQQLIDEEYELSIKACEEVRKTIPLLSLLIKDHVEKKENRREEHEKELFP